MGVYKLRRIFSHPLLNKRRLPYSIIGIRQLSDNNFVQYCLLHFHVLRCTLVIEQTFVHKIGMAGKVKMAYLSNHNKPYNSRMNRAPYTLIYMGKSKNAGQDLHMYRINEVSIVME